MTEIIDTHTHIYPDKIAGKATAAIGAFYGAEMFGAGTADVLLDEGKQAGISRFVVCSCATTHKQVHSINEFLLGMRDAHPEFDALITLHPDMTVEEAQQEAAWALQQGFLGIKLHPDFQQFSVTSPAADKLYMAAIDNRLPILFHAGDRRYAFSNPEKLAEVARRYPALTLVCAHFGGYSEWEHTEVYKGLSNVFFDTSSSLPFLTPQRALQMLRYLGVEHFMFGTDYPMWNATEELERFYNLKLSAEERDLILYQNARRVYAIK